MNNINNYISCLNNRVNNLEKDLNCVICVLSNLDSNKNLLVGYEKPDIELGKDDNLYIQLKGGIFYKKNNNIWNIIGILEPLIIDGGENIHIERGIKNVNTNQT